ncbi:MAG: hypothetical protein V1806_00155 [Pseudomonadota bacterium]
MGLLSDIFGGKKKPAVPARKRRRDDKVGLSQVITLEEMTKKRVCEILSIEDLRGPLVSVVKARKLMCDWTSRVGEKGAYEKRKFLLKQMQQMEGVVIVEEEDQK